MIQETQRRVWAAGTYAGLTPPKLAERLGTSVDTLRRIVRGERGFRAFETEGEFLRRVGEVCGLQTAFFYADFDRLSEISPPPELAGAEAEMRSFQDRQRPHARRPGEEDGPEPPIAEEG